MLTIRHRTFWKSKYFLIFAFLFFVNIIVYIFDHQFPNIISIQTAAIFTPTTTKTTATCVPYTVSDSRPFFERDFPQLNIPQRLLNKSDEDIFRQLRPLRLLILTTARDVESYIDKFRKYSEAIIDLFHPSSRILICESDSSDNTVEKLYQWPRAQVYRYGNISKIYPGRSDRIAFCRNKLLNISHQIKADYLLVVDLDMFASSISSFISNFRYNIDDWSVMTAGSKPYYDIWALRTLSDTVLNFDVWHRIWDIGQNEKKYCSQSVTDQIIGNHQKEIPIQHGLVEVRSAFNGAALYKANLTYGCQYSGAHTTCEHVPFHLCMRDKNHARIFINPAFSLN
jgi:hypothetical protein